MAFKFVLLMASIACASAGYIPTDHSYGSSLSYSTIHKNVAPVVSKTIIQEPQLYHAPSVVVSKPLALTEALPVSYNAPQSLYQAPEYVKNFEYAPKQLSYAPMGKTFLGEPSYGKTIIAEPSYSKTIIAEPSYGKTIIAEPTYGKTIIAEPSYGKTIIAEPVYAKTIASEPIYTKNVYAEPIYQSKSLIAEPVYGKSILAQPAQIYGGKVLSYAPNVAYGGIASHGW
ncbi:adhesive plaque matrix protein-like [Anopheles ziemanni]|uniref:adhesive plaque matrix protein-like n=1 Tax=Anopheles coustani TaxID=139045 RepID=UPI00265B61DE|nr:adhesive plaque matrix protein-like [Anopheles coustani]XP_058170092.1 adhesive plaque matrix protein-like [Anopheles ziemanni]